MLNSLAMFSFSLFDQKNIFVQVWSKKLKLYVLDEIWYLDSFKYAELDGNVNFLFWTGIILESKFGRKKQNCLMKIKLEARLIQTC